MLFFVLLVSICTPKHLLTLHPFRIGRCSNSDAPPRRSELAVTLRISALPHHIPWDTHTLFSASQRALLRSALRRQPGSLSRPTS